MVKHLLYNQRVLGSNPALGTLGIVSENCFSGQPKPCEVNWVVRLGT